MFYIIGLGNPGTEYEGTRHNTGRMAVMKLGKDLSLAEFEFNKKSNALISEGKVIPASAKLRRGKEEKVTLILPETFMNKSGQAVSYFLKAKTGKNKSQENLIVIHDDLDLPLGTFKISYNKGVGGHKGLDSVVKAVKTKEFTRIRIGISGATAKGRAKKPEGEQKVLDFILGKFKPAEMETLKKVFKKASEAVQTIVSDGRDRAMNMFN